MMSGFRGDGGSEMIPQNRTLGGDGGSKIVKNRRTSLMEVPLLTFRFRTCTCSARVHATYIIWSLKFDSFFSIFVHIYTFTGYADMGTLQILFGRNRSGISFKIISYKKDPMSRVLLLRLGLTGRWLLHDLSIAAHID